MESKFVTSSQKGTRKEKNTGVETIAEVAEAEVIYILDDHLTGKSEDVRILFDTLKERIFALTADNDILEKPDKIYISYKHGKYFGEVHPQSKDIKNWSDISYSDFGDPKNFERDEFNVGHYGTGEVGTQLGNLA